ncbi:NAD(P)H-nitrite reductase large subunit [Actinomadura coerulea]|uniref:NAD(P)H-nitrite reductase large subunit n=1 Tax=Actinomadura coerulea TaxID=46159 RepID=A0A7X0KYV8_9ACTN|nr:hypothetical protein [Actinomadura coerulea]MBB6395524.1 NAD(P)H-nitrite reductase large subunit [Actinomadura coerulea]GGQ25658.1 hypothetical protein GCM10010187_47830 [Actinomadura coerulea]
MAEPHSVAGVAEWSDGTREHVDVVLLATGYRPSFASATLRGVAADARHVLTRLREQMGTADRAWAPAGAGQGLG